MQRYMSLISILHSFIFYESHCIPFAIFMIYSQTRDKTRASCLNTYLCLLFRHIVLIHYLFTNHIATPFIFLYFILREREKQETKQTPPRLQILIFASYFYSSFIDFLRITLQTPFLFLYFTLREREKQETKQGLRV